MRALAVVLVVAAHAGALVITEQHLGRASSVTERLVAVLVSSTWRH